MFSLALFSLLVCLFGSNNYSTDFRKIQWKVSTWAMGEPLGFGGNRDHLTLGLG